MDQPGNHNLWAEINGGMRGSTLLRAGAVLSILATGQLFAAGFLGQSSGILINSAWLSWIAALFLLASGFFWIGVHPFLGRFGLGVGVFHFLNGLFLFGVIFAEMNPFLPNASFSIGRTLLLLFFVLIEKKHLRSLSLITLVVAAFLQLMKIGLRLSELLPSLGRIPDSAIDSGLLVLMGVALFLLGGDVKTAENKWAREMLANRATGFNEFNNPEHNWNRAKD